MKRSDGTGAKSETRNLTLSEIREQFFLDPRSNNERLSEVQAQLGILVGNIFDWFVVGNSYLGLQDALQNTEELKKLLAKHRGNAQQPDQGAPYRKLKDWNAGSIRLDFPGAPIASFSEALPILDTDTGGTVRFNDHFIGELHPQGNLIALAACIVASFLNENAITPKVSPSLTSWEREVVDWIWKMIAGGIRPRESDGRIVSGGTIANLTALFIAREEFRGWNSDQPETFRPIMLISPNSHYSLIKAARIIGFERDDEDSQRNQVFRVDTVDVWRMTGADVQRAIDLANLRGQAVVLVSAVAGATDSGFVDDLDSIADVVQRYNEAAKNGVPRIYYHVDAAYGGPFVLAEPNLFKGMGRADAITIDGHKYFYCNYPCGGIFVKNGADFRYLKEEANYIFQNTGVEQEWRSELSRRLGGQEEADIFDEESFEPAGQRTLEGSRGTHGVMQLYMTLKVLGGQGDFDNVKLTHPRAE